MSRDEELRTYRRRETTRKSGYHTCESTTGGEAKILYSELLYLSDTSATLTFTKNDIDFIPLFEGRYGIVAFGGYVKSDVAADIELHLECNVSNDYIEEQSEVFSMPQNEWVGIGVYCKIPDGEVDELKSASVTLNYQQCDFVMQKDGASLEFLSSDFGSISKEDFYDRTFEADFFKKTRMNMPQLFYFDTEESVTKYLQGDWETHRGNPTVFKSCNRCGRYLPVSIYNPANALGFSRHCSKRHPCTHATFCSSRILEAQEGALDMIENVPDLITLDKLNQDEPRITYEYGFQLECRACKKFFENAPLNPQRNPQQFKEDSLRRRALEVLVNHLLGHNLVHFEFKDATKKEFSEHIRKKFDSKCFKCGKPVDAHSFDLDHTMPLAYLYRLDESATCLCPNCNSSKRDKFPADFYTEDELEKLSKITGLSIELLHTRSVNPAALSKLLEDVVWYFDEFLARKDYQKVRDGILTADKINDSLSRVLPHEVVLVEEYKRVTGHYPTTVSSKLFEK